jgi:hypothetical protein
MSLHEHVRFPQSTVAQSATGWPSKIVSSTYDAPDLLRRLTKEFEKDGYVKLPKFLTSEAFAAISGEVRRLHCARVRKDFIMPNYNTDRKMSVISGKEVVRNSNVIAEFYSCRDLRERISWLTGADIHTVHHEDEFLVVNFLDGERDTHGWHLDDPRFALIVIIDSPLPHVGGTLEYVPKWHELAVEENFDPVYQSLRGVDIARRRGLVRSDTLESSDCYLLDAANVLHRVSPMQKEGSRKALNLAFDDRRYRIYGETATRLYA